MNIKFIIVPDLAIARNCGSTEMLHHCQQQAFRPVPQRVNFLWNRPESLFIKALRWAQLTAINTIGTVQSNAKNQRPNV